MNAETALYDVLKNDSGVLASVGVYSSSPAIARDVVEPVKWPLTINTLLIYRAVPVDYTEQHLETDLTINCRGADRNSVEQLATAVLSAVNLYQMTDGEGMFYCSLEAIVPPQDEADNYNLPITVSVKAVKGLL